MGRATGTEIRTCECGCGSLTEPGRRFRQGHWSKLHRHNLTHGESVGGRSTTEYYSYRGAKARCNNPNNPKFGDYGGRGIKFLLTSVAQLLDEIGRKPKGMTLDRIDNDGHYELGNLRWATAKQQRANQQARRLSQFTDEQLLTEVRRRKL